MRKIVPLSIIILSILVILSGCASNSEGDVEGAWYLSSLKEYHSGVEREFDQEVYLFNENGTGIEIYLPGEYKEQYSYIAWKLDSAGNTISVKHSEEYSYDLDIEELDEDELKCSFYYSNDPDTYYLATYTKMDTEEFKYIGCWNYAEYYYDGQYYEPDPAYFYFYPDGTFEQIYYQVQDEITETGTWTLSGSYLRMDWDGFSSIHYDVDITHNILDIYDTSEDGADIVYVYKRYYGLITNSPPVTYPTNLWQELNRYFAAILKRVTGNLS